MKKNPWPASCAKLYQGVADAIESAHIAHKRESPYTRLKFNLEKIKEPGMVFRLNVQVLFGDNIALENRTRLLPVINNLNEVILHRYVKVGIPSRPVREAMSYALNLYEVGFHLLNEHSAGGKDWTTIVYSDNGGAETRHRTWNSSIAGHHIIEFLLRGLIDGDRFPN